MPRQRGALKTEREAVAIVRKRYEAEGWTVETLLGQVAQAQEGCDFIATPRGGGAPCAVEVKGWGEPLLKADGAFTYQADLRVEQFKRAKRDSNWRMEIVANLTAARTGGESVQCLTVTAARAAKAQPSLYRLSLDGLESEVQEIQCG